MTRYLAVFTNRRMLVTLLLGFSGGLPLALIGGTLQAWLAEAKVDIATIGLFSLVGLPYAVKFLWGPLMDNRPLPFLGLRRGWMVVCQIGLIASIIGLALCSPGENMALFSAVAFLVAFFSASQDIVIDAYRVEIVEKKEELGAAASTYVTGYRTATVVSGGLALIMADHMSWTVVYLIMAAVNSIGLITILCSKEPTVTRKVKVVSLRDSVVLPFLEFFQRQGAMEILIFIMVYKLSTLMATALTTNFLLEFGYSKTSIGAVQKGFGLVATILGTLTGGSLMMRFGLKRSLWIFGIFQALAGLTFCVISNIALEGAAKQAALVGVVSMDNFMMGLGTAALVGFMMNFASKQFTATQYALLTSVMAVSRVILIAHAGDLVKLMGWNWFFISTVPLAIPGLLLLNRFDHWQTMSTAALHARIPKFDLALMALFVFSLLCLSSEPFWSLAGLKEFATPATLTGAAGVVLVVLLGLVRPYLTLKPRPGTVRAI